MIAGTTILYWFLVAKDFTSGVQKVLGSTHAHQHNTHTLSKLSRACSTPVMLLLAASVKMAFHQAADK